MSNIESQQPVDSSSAIDRKRVFGLTAVFGLLYFAQGIREPTEGLIAQPTRSLLRNWGYSADTVTTYMALLALPWAAKPLYGLLTDFVPIAGTRRRSWLLLTTFITTAASSPLCLHTTSRHGISADGLAAAGHCWRRVLGRRCRRLDD